MNINPYAIPVIANPIRTMYRWFGIPNNLEGPYKNRETAAIINENKKKSLLGILFTRCDTKAEVSTNVVQGIAK